MREYLKRILFSCLVLSLCVNITSFGVCADDSLNENEQEVSTQVDTENDENSDDSTVIEENDQLKEDISEKANVIVDTTTDKYEPTVEVSIDDQILELNRDYTVQYETDLDNQVGQVTVTGINNYTGSVVKKFDIVDETEEVSNDVDTYSQEEKDVGIVTFNLEQSEELKDGVYIIRSSLNNNYVLDVNGGSYNNSANVQLYGYNGTNAQLWRVSHDSEGYITFTNVKSGKVLDLNGGSVTNGRNIQQYDSNGTKAQKWVLKGDSNGYEIVSAANSNYVLDLNGAIVRNSQNIQLYQSNGTKAQKWVFSTYVSPTERANQLASENINAIQNGTYVINTAKNNGYVLDVNGGSYNNSANVQLYGYNGTNAQLWTISHDSEGFVTFTNVKSGKVLDLNGATISNGRNIQQYESNGTRAQKWIVTGNSNGYEIRSALNPDYVVDLNSGEVRNSQNIQLYQSNGTQAQKWTFSFFENTESTMSISDVQIIDIGTTGYTIKCKVSSNKGIAKVLFPTWTKRNGQDDIVWGEGSVSGNIATYRVQTSSHNYEYGSYITDIYLYDLNNFKIGCSAGSVNTDVGGFIVNKSLPNVNYFSQKDSRWSNLKIGKYNFGSTGCVPTVASMLVNSINYNNSTVTPYEMGKILYNAGYYNYNESGTKADVWSYIAKKYNLSYSSNLSFDTMCQRLKEGDILVGVVESGKFCPWSGETHEILFFGLDSAGYTYVHDPYTYERIGRASLKDIYNNRSTYWGDRLDGGPFFAFKTEE